MKLFISNFVKAFTDGTFISNYNGGKAAGEFCKLAFAPFYLTIILGFMITVANDKWDRIFFATIYEFIHMMGMKLSVYLVIAMLALGLLFNSVTWIRNSIASLMKPLSHTGFAITAVLAGVLLGLAIPASVQAKNFEPFFHALNLSLFTVLAALIFYFSPQVLAITFQRKVKNILGSSYFIVVPLFAFIVLVCLFKIVIIDGSWQSIMGEGSIQRALIKPLK